MPSLGLPPDLIDPIAFVAQNGGYRETDSLDVFPEVQPDNAEDYYNRAVLKAYKLRDVTGALADLDEAILLGRGSANELNPQYANAYYHRAVLKQIKLDDVLGALSDYDRASVISIAPWF